MYRSSPFRSTLNPAYIRFGHVWSMCRSSPFRSTLNPGYIRFGHVWSMYRSSPFRSTLNTGYIRFGHVWSMYRSSPFRSTLNTGYIRFGHVWSMYRSSPFRSTLNTASVFGEKTLICVEIHRDHGTVPATNIARKNGWFPIGISKLPGVSFRARLAALNPEAMTHLEKRILQYKAMATGEKAPNTNLIGWWVDIRCKYSGVIWILWYIIS